MRIPDDLSVAEYARSLARDAWCNAGGDPVSFEKAYKGVSDAGDGSKVSNGGADKPSCKGRALSQGGSAGGTSQSAALAHVP